MEQRREAYNKQLAEQMEYRRKRDESFDKQKADCTYIY